MCNPETSVSNQLMLRDNPEEGKIQLTSLIIIVGDEK
jgi:hypothetical protein